MSFKAFFQELKGHVKEGLITRTTSRGRARREVEVEVEVDVNDQQMWEIPSETSFPSCSSSTAVHQLGGSRWANLPPELLLDIVARVESSRRSWPSRRDLVACASVCRSWRQAAKEVTRSPELCGCLTFPSSLKQPGPRDTPIQCFIKRDRSNSTFRLYLGLTPALSGDMSKLLLVARKIRRPMSTDFVISLVPDDFSRANSSYVGKLRSNFLGTKFTVYDSQPPASSTVALQPRSRSKAYWRSTNNLKQVSPRTPVGNFSIATVSYELNVLRTRGPRRMRCTMHSIPVRAIQELMHRDQAGESSSVQTGGDGGPEEKKVLTDRDPEPNPARGTRDKSLVLRNKAPRWHEQLQCWCLNFKGRVTVASVKNFQLVAAATEGGGAVPASEQEAVILQFGKIGKDIFTMDYRYPISAFQAFAICLSSFDTKPACE